MECLFCQIAQKKKPAYLVGENRKTLAFLDLAPVSDGHTLLISKKHFSNLSESDEESWNHLLPLLKEVVAKLEKSLQPRGFNFISNLNSVAYQTIFHLHIHVIPKYQKNQGFIWTVNPQLSNSLEEIAKKLSFF